MALMTALVPIEDDSDDVEAHVYRLPGQPVDRAPDGPDVSLVHSMALSGIDSRLRRSNRDHGTVVDQDKPRWRHLRRHR